MTIINDFFIHFTIYTVWVRSFFFLWPLTKLDVGRTLACHTYTHTHFTQFYVPRIDDGYILFLFYFSLCTRTQRQWVHCMSVECGMCVVCFCFVVWSKTICTRPHSIFKWDLMLRSWLFISLHSFLFIFYFWYACMYESVSKVLLLPINRSYPPSAQETKNRSMDHHGGWGVVGGSTSRNEKKKCVFKYGFEVAIGQT